LPHNIRSWLATLSIKKCRIFPSVSWILRPALTRFYLFFYYLFRVTAEVWERLLLVCRTAFRDILVVYVGRLFMVLRFCVVERTIVRINGRYS
jgi:hypothetical protein